MRKYTLVFSVIAHLGVIAAVYIAPAFATDELPEPPRTSAFIVVHAIMPEPPPVMVRSTPAPSLDAAPIEEPDGVKPEPPVAIESAPPVDPGALVGGPSFSDLGPVNDVVAAPPLPQGPKEPVPVGGVIQPPKKVVDVAPIYPPIALAARKAGLVILQAVIDEDGSVREVKVLRSDPLFDQSAMNAVRQWRFTRPTLNGQPIPVVMTVTVGFTPN